MQVRTYTREVAGSVRSARPLPPGTGIFIAGAVSLLIWGLIAATASFIA